MILINNNSSTSDSENVSFFHYFTLFFIFLTNLSVRNGSHAGGVGIQSLTIRVQNIFHFTSTACRPMWYSFTPCYYYGGYYHLARSQLHWVMNISLVYNMIKLCDFSVPLNKRLFSECCSRRSDMVEKLAKSSNLHIISCIGMLGVSLDCHFTSSRST